MTTHHFYTAKGGQGCTTSMVTEAAATQGRVLLVDATGTGDLNAILGHYPAINDGRIDEYGPGLLWVCSWEYGDQPEWRDTDFDHVFIDWGNNIPLAINAGEEMVLVTRNAYLSLMRAVKMPCQRIDRVVIVTDPAGVLTERDIYHVLRVPTMNTYFLDPAVARSVDAGILYIRNRSKLA